ncbi:MAG: sugar phosphate isomerase/epimerase family protein [Armatimonadota bacterium]
MEDARIAAKINNLGMDRYEAMELVAQWGIGGVHLTASGPFAPENLTRRQRRDLVRHVESLGLTISAIMRWGGGVDLCEEEDWEENVEEGKRLLELAADLECGIWGAHVGVMPWETSDPGWQNMVRAMEVLGEHGESVGACVAIEMGPEPPRIVRRLIETVGSEAIRVNYDPANLIIWPSLLAQRSGEEYDRECALEQYEPVEGARTLGEFVVHCHAKDAIVQEDGQYLEVPLGTGWVDFERWVSLLDDEAGYEGFYAIEREVGDDPVGDIRRAVEFLRSI